MLEIADVVSKGRLVPTLEAPGNFALAGPASSDTWAGFAEDLSLPILSLGPESKRFQTLLQTCA